MNHANRPQGIPKAKPLLKMCQSSASDPIEALASAMQSQLILRCLIGVLAEASVFLEQRRVLVEKYLPNMHIEGRDAYTKVRKSFNKKDLLRLIRHNYLYHYPNPKLVEKAFESIPDDEPWEWYFSQSNTNSLYLSCELVMGYGLMTETREPTSLGAFGVVMAKAMERANEMPDFLMRLIEVITVQFLGKDVFKPQPATTIADAPALGEFWVPFFVESSR